MTDLLSINPASTPSAVGDYADCIARSIGAENVTIKGHAAFVAPFRIASLLSKRPERATVIVYTLIHLAAAVKASSLTAAGKVPRIVYFATDFRPMSTIGVYDSLCRKADAVVVASDLQRDLFLKTFTGVPAEKVSVVIPDSGTISAEPVTPREGLLFCAPLTEESGIGRLIDAMALDPSKARRLKVVGTGKGNMVMRLVRESKRLNLPVEWLGEYDRDKAVEAAMNSAAAIYPSTSAEADCYSMAYLRHLLPLIASTQSAAAPIAGALLPDGPLTVDLLDNLIASATLRTTSTDNASAIRSIINNLRP